MIQEIVLNNEPEGNFEIDLEMFANRHELYVRIHELDFSN